MIISVLMEAESNKFLPWINFFKLTLYHLPKLFLSEEQKLNLFGIDDSIYRVFCLYFYNFFPIK